MVSALPSSATRKTRTPSGLEDEQGRDGLGLAEDQLPAAEHACRAMRSMARISSGSRSANRSTSSKQVNGSSGPAAYGSGSRCRGAQGWGPPAETNGTCTKIAVLGTDELKENVQQRSTTTTTKGLVTTVARDNSKGKDGPVTGFYLKGYEGTPVLGADGPAAGTCPADPSGFVYNGNAVTTESGGGLQVTHDGTNWYSIG
jgi:hypothetical protein